jgi:uncharacterized protein
MIPEFPKFKKLELSDEEEIESITRVYPPYSDFNFISMWCWDTTGRVQISKLHGNLVVRFTDYISDEPFYSFLGNKKINDVAKILLDFSVQEGLRSELKLIPEATAMELDPQSFSINEDRDNFDYVLSIQKMTTYSGTQLMSKRNYVNRFKKHYQSNDRVIKPLDHAHKEELVELFKTWTDVKGYSEEEIKHELDAFTRFLIASDYLDSLVTFGVYMYDKMVGFWIVEITSSEYAISHFEKANTSAYKGIYPYLKQKLAIVLHKKGIKYVNLEQDLGLPGLREAKMDYHPCTYLRKYKVQLL